MRRPTAPLASTKVGVILVTIVTLLALPDRAAAATISYDESVDGDLWPSPIGMTPSYDPWFVGTVDDGINTIAGTQDLGDFDSFYFAVDPGYQVTELSFGWTLDPGPGNTVAGTNWNLRESDPFGVSLGVLVVDLFSSTNPVSAFTTAVPLGPGTYWVRNDIHSTGEITGWSADYEWSITAETVPAPIPEPTTLFLVGTGLAAAGARWRRRRNRGQSTDLGEA